MKKKYTEDAHHELSGSTYAKFQLSRLLGFALEHKGTNTHTLDFVY
jgi:hypothetical protein